ncbi:copper resistance protein B [Massilia sp. YIM B04103]|uniref:copper resistance protein B n=1 Tax=Massilia sp. YIM B04103 TaxID=2963106 RepID=UPI0035A71355
MQMHRFVGTLVCGAMSLPATWAQDSGAQDAAAVRDPHAYADTYVLGVGQYAIGPQRLLHMADEQLFSSLLIDGLEWRRGGGDGSAAYEAQAWYGSDYNRLVLKAEGDVAKGRLREARTELLWGHAISPYWDTQLGVRKDHGPGPRRTWLALGLQGLAPYWFEVDATVYVGSGGRTALRLNAEYELLLAQKWVLQPRTEWTAYGKADPAAGVGSGLSEGMFGLRLRYDLSRQFAPYVGVEWNRKFGGATVATERARETRWVAGLRFWY